uniref:Uncharacterized protein n=1 Tax=Pongo abelii TaxID=9601 RepID=A0A8I5TAL1_PONAB
MAWDAGVLPQRSSFGPGIRSGTLIHHGGQMEQTKQSKTRAGREDRFSVALSRCRGNEHKTLSHVPGASDAAQKPRANPCSRGIGASVLLNTMRLSFITLVFR